MFRYDDYIIYLILFNKNKQINNIIYLIIVLKFEKKKKIIIIMKIKKIKK